MIATTGVPEPSLIDPASVDPAYDRGICPACGWEYDLDDGVYHEDIMYCASCGDEFNEDEELC